MTGDTKWMLGGDPPEAAVWDDAPEVKAEAEILSVATHTGIDPNGRAVGPLEDHTVEKPVLDARTGKPKAAPKARKRT